MHPGHASRVIGRHQAMSPVIKLCPSVRFASVTGSRHCRCITTPRGATPDRHAGEAAPSVRLRPRYATFSSLRADPDAGCLFDDLRTDTTASACAVSPSSVADSQGGLREPIPSLRSSGRRKVVVEVSDEQPQEIAARESLIHVSEITRTIHGEIEGGVRSFSTPGFWFWQWTDETRTTTASP
jgi:hypothetical protein